MKPKNHSRSSVIFSAAKPAVWLPLFTCPPGSPDGEYKVDVAPKGDHRYFSVWRGRE